MRYNTLAIPGMTHNQINRYTPVTRHHNISPSHQCALIAPSKSRLGCSEVTTPAVAPTGAALVLAEAAAGLGGHRSTCTPMLYVDRSCFIECYLKHTEMGN